MVFPEALAVTLGVAISMRRVFVLTLPACWRAVCHAHGCWHAQGDDEARAISSVLIAASEQRLRRAAVVGARALPGDWRVEIETDLPDVVPLAGTAMLAPPGAAPSMEAAAGLGVDEAVAPIPQMDSALLQVAPSCHEMGQCL